MKTKMKNNNMQPNIVIYMQSIFIIDTEVYYDMVAEISYFNIYEINIKTLRSLIIIKDQLGCK